jgi:hypothetical protein
MRFLFAIVLMGCGSQVTTTNPVTDSEAIDSAVDSTTDSTTDVPTMGETGLTDTGSIDTAPPMPGACSLTDPLNPPIACGPEAGGATTCFSTSKVDSCPMDNGCMAYVKQGLSVMEHRIGRLRFWSPDALLSLTSIAFDPNVNAKCANGGTENLSWLLRINRSSLTLETGGARPSTDATKFSFLAESYSGATASAICPGFVGPTAPLDLRPVSTMISATGGVDASLAQLNIPLFGSSGIEMVLPLREVRIRIPSLADATCFGKWDKRYWCDGDSLGWTPGGSIVAKITAEDADRVPIKSAGCQSLCAILVNDATKTDGKVCKRGPDGKIPEIGTHCVGGASCKNAFLLSTTFASYGIDITP